MFHKTRLQLTLLNSIVFIIILIFLGRSIYFYFESQVFKGADQSLYTLINRVEDAELTPTGLKFIRDPSIYLLVWDPDKKLMEDVSERNPFFVQAQKKFYPDKVNKLQNIKVADYSFRSLTTKLETDVGTFKIQLIRSVDAENKVLNRLLFILLAGGGVGILIAVGAGFFLAGRALVPIKNAWDNQQQFVSDASHELRTPLAVIQSRTEMLFQSPSATIEEKAIDISVISKEARRLNKLVTSLLTLARSDTGQMVMEKEMFPLHQLVEEIVEQYADIAGFQDKTIRIGKAVEVPFFGDKERIHQLLVILVDNAMKFTKEGGEIVLSCRRDSQSIILSVHDNGIGIAADDIPRIFNRFYQVETSRSKEEGAGLGLSIAKWIVDNHYGNFKVKSSPGKGTQIDVIFPKNSKK
ncbi:signal transduction histidine kinase [Peribacillus deserti]|uniref:histidine kinase n=1 Tax=Peribacillus deserti TaxID=673318 RepID=A0ABS2QCY7_9BACI|nr:HAMP domain-containing sensor histidine kinase [Peribacillus deserti]MBM7691021.1 signal transduction histidine kinase [Peribacillus deserti]